MVCARTVAVLRSVRARLARPSRARQASGHVIVMHAKSSALLLVQHSIMPEPMAISRGARRSLMDSFGPVQSMPPTAWRTKTGTPNPAGAGGAQ